MTTFCLWPCLGRNSQESTSKLYRHENFLPRLPHSQAPWLMGIHIPNTATKTMHRLINDICYLFLNPSENDLWRSVSRDKLPRGYSNFCSSTISQLRPPSHSSFRFWISFCHLSFSTWQLIPLINLLTETIFFTQEENNKQSSPNYRCKTHDHRELSIREIIH